MKTRIGILLAGMLILCIALSPAFAREQRVFDCAGLFSDEQVERLESEINGFRQQTGMDFAVLTTVDAYSSIAYYADDYYEQHGFGTGDKNSGVLLVIDLKKGDFWFSTEGRMIDYLYDQRMNQLTSLVAAKLSEGRNTGDFSAGVSLAISTVKGYVREGIPEGHYQYDIFTNQQTTSAYKKIETRELVISLVIAAVVMWITYAKTNHEYTLKGSTYSYDVNENASKTLTATRDEYLRTETRTVRRPTSTPGYGGGRPMGGGMSHSGGIHSGTHISSGGHTHGGGGGHF